jgi:Domain of unknown function (DUF4258)
MLKAKKPKKSVARIVLSTTNASRIIRRLAQNSGAVFITSHASKRMAQRKVTRPQVIDCITKGAITEGPAVDIKGSWKVTVSRAVCGDHISVVLALDWDAENASYVVVVTVIRD